MLTFSEYESTHYGKHMRTSQHINAHIATTAFLLPSSHACRTFSVSIRQLPEGIWGVVASDIPGLNIEGETEEEAREEVIQWAQELLVNNKVISTITPIRLVFY